MPKNRTPLFLSLAAASGVGYYLYNAGGKPKVAEKQFESDMHQAAEKVKGELSGMTVNAEKQGSKYGQEAGAKIDSAVSTLDREFSKAKSEVEAFGKATKANAIKKVDDFDRKMEEGTDKAKSGISSWFGGK